jgi:ring-1,2-phenylacetyl-CoA epoxidase subunit PaaA
VSQRVTEAELLGRIERGERIESAEEMTEEYRQSLIHLMTMQADSELAGAYGYVPWIMKAPGVEEKLVVAQIVKDETRHAKVMYDLLQELGEDVTAHVGTHDQSFARRLDDSEADIGTARVASDKRVNIFYYPIDTWADFVMFNFCMDRGAGHQLEDVRHSSYGPWRRGVEGIFKEERMHIRHGELWVKRLAENAATRDDAERTFHKWYVRTMNIFGRRAARRTASTRSSVEAPGQRRGPATFSEEVRARSRPRLARPSGSQPGRPCRKRRRSRADTRRQKPLRGQAHTLALATSGPTWRRLSARSRPEREPERKHQIAGLTLTLIS